LFVGPSEKVHLYSVVETDDRSAIDIDMMYCTSQATREDANALDNKGLTFSSFQNPSQSLNAER
jgi:hypothetical protein